MSKETSGFSIAANITEAVMDEADSYDETLEYAKLTMAKARTQHPDLYRYLAETAKEQGEYWFSYGIASAIAYAVVTKQLEANGTTIEITPDDVTVHKSIADRVFGDPRWDDEVWVFERVSTRDGVEADSGLGFFLNVVDSVAPEFAGYIADFTPQIETPINRRHTLRGFYDGFMPFYGKIRRAMEIVPSD